MKRDDAVELIASTKEDAVSVTIMRSVLPWYEAGAASENHFDCTGCMGGAGAIGLGLALAQPERKVYVLDGDGSLLMQLGTLASIAGAAPPNLYHFVLVNRVYETSGKQPIPGGEDIDFAGLAKSAGYRLAESFSDLGILREKLPAILASEGPVLLALEVDPEDYGESVPPSPPADPSAKLRLELTGKSA
jgi:phosphonopyruvate decarboxylase